MVKIYIQKQNVKFDKATKTFSVKGKGIKFATQYEVINQKTGAFSIFDLVESTGSEWAPSTIWIYKNSNDFFLHVGNDDVTKQHVTNYKNAKLR